MSEDDYDPWSPRPAPEPAKKSKPKKTEAEAVDDDNVAGKQLKTFIERIEFIEGEIEALNDDKKELYAEIKGQGFSPKILKLIVRRRKMDPEERKNDDAILDLYETALGMV